LDKGKTIEVAKIVTNEERLYQEIKSLQEKVGQLNDSVNNIVNKYESALSKIELLAGEIRSREKRIQDLSEEQLELEKEKRKSRVYAFTMAGVESSQLRSFDIGINYARPKMQYFFAIDPVIQEKLVFKLGLGFKLF
jgi:SMC interacting uncharacterized protein involved in chromosome segregation